MDALYAYALFLAGVTESDSEDPGEPWPDLALFLGDQVYADETSPQMRDFIERRRDPEQAPWYELKDFEEYAHLYRLAWSDPAIRWLLSTRADGDDLRRPRPPRRLEHQLELAPGDGGHGLVAGSGHRRPGGVLGSPAPRQPRAGRAPRGRAVEADRVPPRAGRARRHRPARRTRRTRRPAPGDLPVELLPRLRHPGQVGRRRLPGGAGPRAGAPVDARRRRADVAGRPAAGRRRPPPGGDLVAVPAGAGSAPHRVVRRGDRRGRLGTARDVARRTQAATPPTSSTGRRSSGASATWPSWCSR